MPKKKKIFIIFMGPQASGKGTQSLMLGKRMKLPVISVGELCRTEIRNKTILGKKIEKVVVSGALVSEDLISKILDKRLAKKDVKNGFILDGYPRNLKQLNYLGKKFNGFKEKGSIFLALNVDISDKEARNRLSGRRVCSCGQNYHKQLQIPRKSGACDSCGGRLVQRKDDEPVAIIRRLRLFHKKSKSLLEFFADLDILININGEQKIKKIYLDITNILKKKRLLK